MAVLWTICAAALCGSCQAKPADRAASSGAAAGSAVSTAPARPKEVYQSPLAGRWYDADPKNLGEEIDGYLANAKTDILPGVQALILPHAGYQFSAQTAAYGIRQIEGKKYSRVVVMGPSHRLPMENIASVPDVTHYATPLGEVPLDVDFIEKLKASPLFETIKAAHDGEHSVQIELPLLQKALGEFTLVPIVVGQLDLNAAREMAEQLKALIDENTLVIASSDFTHYGPNYRYIPFSENVAANLRDLDMGAFDQIEAKSADGFGAYIEKTKDTICGRDPIKILLSMLPENSKPTLLKYDTSGHVTGDFSNSVSYLAVAFQGKWSRGGRADEAAPAPAIETETPSVTLNDADKANLLKLARGVLQGYLKTGRKPTPEELGVEATPGMRQVMGAFVTLEENGDLRGCIGEIEPRRALFEAVIDHAVNAAVNDPRFRPVTADEAPGLHIEISALTPPKPVDSYNDIIIGKHGMTVQVGLRRAVFLPQVAPEQGWDLAQTLTHLSQKAGLRSDAWKSDEARFTVFEAIVFSEDEP